MTGFRLRSVSPVLVALDFDGTLALISPHPDDARPVPGTDQVLRDVRATGAALAVVTGRSVASLLRVSGFGAIPGIVIYGTHGAERWEAGTLRTAAAPPGLEELRVRLPGLVASLVREPAVWIEDKSLSLVVHARLTAQPERVLEQLRGPVEKATAAAGMGVRPGREVLEICLPGFDKGTAIRELIRDDTAAVLYAGDDVGDLAAVAEVNAWAGRSGRPKLIVGVHADEGGPLAGRADVSVPDPRGVVDFLRGLLLAWWVRGWCFRDWGGHQGRDRGADGAVDYGQDLGLGASGPVVPLGDRAHPDPPDIRPKGPGTTGGYVRILFPAVSCP